MTCLMLFFPEQQKMAHRNLQETCWLGNNLRAMQWVLSVLASCSMAQICMWFCRSAILHQLLSTFQIFFFRFICLRSMKLWRFHCHDMISVRNAVTLNLSENWGTMCYNRLKKSSTNQPTGSRKCIATKLKTEVCFFAHEKLMCLCIYSTWSSQTTYKMLLWLGPNRSCELIYI